MMRMAINNFRRKGAYTPVQSVMYFCCLVITVLISFYSCSNNQQASPPAGVVQKQTITNTFTQAAAAQPAIADEEHVQGGYIYQQRDRRDPFIPLIVPKKPVMKGEDIKVGTLEGYDISEFTLAAVAKKGREYFALITTPDNRSFTINKGTPIGLNKGKVKDIRRDRIVLVEFSRDFRGKLKPRELILEFHKGEVE
jgi:type IV pilus assembly protein PilP